MTTLPRLLAFVNVFLSLAMLPVLAQTIPLGNPGFETGISPGLPTTTGYWAGDLNSVVTTENGVSPYAGAKMLRFDHMAPDGVDQGTGADTVQLVDLSPYAPTIAQGGFALTFSAYFNRSDSTYNQFATIIRSYNGALASFPSNMASSTALQADYLSSDSNPTTWQLLSSTLTLPTDTTYVAVWVSALSSGNIVNYPAGYYADNASLAAVPEPATAPMLAGASALSFIIWRRRTVGRNAGRG